MAYDREIITTPIGSIPLEIRMLIFDYIIHHNIYTHLWLVNKEWYEIFNTIPHYQKYVKSCREFNVWTKLLRLCKNHNYD
jgi:hypothetical protein